MARLGLGPERLHELRPDLVIASISGFGADGPLAAHPGHDISYLAFSGLLDRIGLVGGAPVVPPVPLVDLLAGVFPAVGILAYRLRAERTGLGAVIDAPMVEAVSLLPSSLLADVLGGAVVPGRGEWRLGSGLATFAVYPAADGNVSVAAQEPQFWRNLCDVVGMSDLADRQRDPDAQSIIGARLTAFFGSRTRAEIEHAFEGRDACVTPVLSVEEMIVSDHAVAREYIDREGPHAVPVPELPFTVDGRRLRTDRPAPAQGADQQEIVRTEPK
jgi:crotonobetainyl-CoA:carnitine CoA-transferase CaiB-like acyl-CoA transferase